MPPAERTEPCRRTLRQRIPKSINQLVKTRLLTIMRLSRRGGEASEDGGCQPDAEKSQGQLRCHRLFLLHPKRILGALGEERPKGELQSPLPKRGVGTTPVDSG